MDKKDYGFSSERQRIFAEQWNGNCRESAEKAGITHEHARRLMSHPRYHRFRTALKELREREYKNNVKSRVQLQEFWTKVIDNNLKDKENKPIDLKMKDRLTASRLLGQSEAMFTENHNITPTEGLEITVEYVKSDK